MQIWLFEVVFFWVDEEGCAERFADIATRCPIYIFLLTDGRCSLTKLSRCHSVLRIESTRISRDATTAWPGHCPQHLRSSFNMTWKSSP